jgi:glycosyltransferase involved in cell wall biosynthesis
MWNRLQAKMSVRNGMFSVYFMNRIEPNRSWIIDQPFLFPNKIWDMKILYVKNIPLRFSLSYCISAINNSENLILGSSWNDLNIIFIVILKRLKLITNTINFWTEANKLTLGGISKSKIKYFFRKWILDTCDGYYILPGKMSQITLDEWGVNSHERCLFLPNIPHDAYDKNSGTWTGSNNEIPSFVIVARLDEKLKGIKNFLMNIGFDNIRKIKITIIGSGPDDMELKKFISDNSISSNIILMGELNVDEVIAVLKISDCFILPSFSDPSPLALIEAIKIGLPILVSLRCGNHFECLIEGKNGFGFDPFSPVSVQQAFHSFIAEKNNWPYFSKKSLCLASSFHNTDYNLVRLVDII